jgi:hypothetical protein
LLAEKDQQNQTEFSKIQADAENGRKLQLEATKAYQIKNADAKERTFNLEKRAVAANLIIKNLPLAQGVEFETNNQTRAAINAIFAKMNLEGVVVTDCYRFKKGAKSPAHIPPFTIVKLKEPGMKSEIFKKVNLLSNSEWKSCSISNEVPAPVRAEVRLKEEEAWNYPKVNAGTRTKIELVKGIPKIKVKPAGSASYIFLKAN